MKLLKIEAISHNWLCQRVLTNRESQVKFYWATIIVFIVIKKPLIVVIETVFIIIAKCWQRRTPPDRRTLWNVLFPNRSREKFPHKDAAVLQWINRVEQRQTAQSPRAEADYFRAKKLTSVHDHVTNRSL